MPSGTPSLSVSTGQPTASTTAPRGVLGHLSMPSVTPSLSESIGQPTVSTAAPAGVLGHLSYLSAMPSPSESLRWIALPAWKNDIPKDATKWKAELPNVEFEDGT